MSKVTHGLNFMYCMEGLATQVYAAQKGSFKDSEMAGKLKAAEENERQHIKNLRARLTQLKGTPSVFAFLFSTAGGIFGFLTRATGKANIMKADIWIEQKAISDYKKYLKKVQFDTTTIELLNKIIADEERHVESWTTARAVFSRKVQPAQTSR